MLEMLYECERAYGLPEGGVPEDQLRLLFGDAPADAALAAGLIGRYRGCRRSPRALESLVALTERGRARVAETERDRILREARTGDVAVAVLFGARG